MSYYNENKKKLHEIMAYSNPSAAQKPLPEGIFDPAPVGIEFDPTVSYEEPETVQPTSSISSVSKPVSSKPAKKVNKEINQAIKSTGVEVTPEIKKQIKQDWSKYDAEIGSTKSKADRDNKLLYILQAGSNLFTAGTGVKSDPNFYEGLRNENRSDVEFAKEKKISAIKDFMNQRSMDREDAKETEDTRRYNEGMGFQREKFDWEKQQKKEDKATNDYSLHQGNDGRMYKINKKTGDVTPVSEQGAGSLRPTEAQKVVDREFGKDYSMWTSGGRSRAAGEIQKLEALKQKLIEGKVSTGATTGLLPDSLTTAGVLGARADVNSSIMSSLREILGSQFTENEGARVIKNTWNEQDSTDNNIRRIGQLIDDLKAQSRDKDNKTQYYESNGTLQNYKSQPSQPVSSQPVEGQQNQAAQEVNEIKKLDPQSGKTAIFDGATKQFIRWE